jgi:tetratricopeptide (TPR) repeat protein
MRKIHFIFGFLLITLLSKAQLLKTESDTLALIEEIPFPKASANIVFGFNAKMLDLYHLPRNTSATVSLENMLKKLEKDKKNVGLLLDIYFAYKAKNESDKALPYLQKAYGIAMELYELNPSNLELVEQLSTMMIEVNRMGDVPNLWKDYTVRNPQVAKGWAKLAVFQAQVLDTIGLQLSIARAFELDADEPELYVAAISQVLVGIIVNMQQNPNSSPKADLSFFKRALSQKPESEMVKMGYYSAQLIELFYAVILNNIEELSGNKAFDLKLTENQKITIAELEKAYKQLLNDKKIVNKYIVLKSLLVLEVLKGSPEMGQAYLEESKKYIDSDALIYKFLSFGYLPKRKFADAIPLLKKATELSPSYDDLFALAKLYFENSEFQKSNEILEKMLATYPERTDVAMGIISNLMRQRKFEDACSLLFRLETMYKEDLDLEKNDPYFLYYKAVCTLVYSKKTDEARNALQIVIDKNLEWSGYAKSLLKKFN